MYLVPLVRAFYALCNKKKVELNHKNFEFNVIWVRTVLRQSPAEGIDLIQTCHGIVLMNETPMYGLNGVALLPFYNFKLIN